MKLKSVCNLQSAWRWTRSITYTLHEAEFGLQLALCMKMNSAHAHTLHEAEFGVQLALCMKMNSAHNSHSTWSWIRPTTCILHETEFGLYIFSHKLLISQRLAHDMKCKSHTYNVYLKHLRCSEYLKTRRRMVYVPACGWLGISFGHYLNQNSASYQFQDWSFSRWCQFILWCSALWNRVVW
jgi:hypothetical protein